MKYELFDKSQLEDFDKEDYELDLKNNESVVMKILMKINIMYIEL